MKYLIISTNAIGDTYLSAVAIRVIQNYDIKAEIDFLSTSKCLPILDLLPLNNIIVIHKDILNLILHSIKIRNRSYDYVFTFFPGLVNSLFYLVSRGKKKGGYVNFIRHSEWYNKKHEVIVKGALSRNLVWLPGNNYLDRIKFPLSVFWDLSHNNCFQKKIMEINVSVSKYSDSILVHPFSRSKERTLNQVCLKKLVGHLEKYNKVFVIGQTDDFLDFKDSTIQKLSNLSFKELAEVIVSCKLFIAVDSFPIHIADAHNSNFIGLFGPTNPKSVLVNHLNAIKFDTKRIDHLSFEAMIYYLEEPIKSKLKIS
jgi:ADP-heptose:LPS heptosyltransferase